MPLFLREGDNRIRVRRPAYVIKNNTNGKIGNVNEGAIPLYYSAVIFNSC